MTFREKWNMLCKRKRPRTASMILLSLIGGIFTIFHFTFVNDENKSVAINKFYITAQKLNTFNASAINLIKASIAKYNREQMVLNADLYGSLKDDAVVIVVQVHNRLDYLRQTIDSLSKVRLISNTLLVFSHDYYDDDINLTVQAINFTRVVQIFYPHSIQTHPNQFPGQSPWDCPKDIKKRIALQVGCLNAKYPDLYGHYRNPEITQVKHHWWWKINMAFNHLKISKTHPGMFLFIEDDHYVVKDAIPMIKLMEATSDKEEKRCGIFSLGIESEKRGYQYESRKVRVTTWISNLGLAFNRETWKAIEQCATEFCTYDDYNWDWTLQYINQKCVASMFNVMALEATRIIHIGRCGIHHKSSCNSSDVLTKISDEVDNAEQYLYPESLDIVSTRHIERIMKKSGGWSDPRDHALCMQTT